jgi:hypothetical protein
MHGNPRSDEAQSHPASEVSDTERVERLLSDPPEAHRAGLLADSQPESTTASRGTEDGGAQASSPVEIPRRPETNSVTGFMSLGKKPTLALLPEMTNHEEPSSLRGPVGELDANFGTSTERAQSSAADGGSGAEGGGGGGGGGGGKSLPFAPAGSSGRGSTPFVIAGRRE